MSDGRTYPLCPRLGVGVVVFAGQRVLLIRRARPPRLGQWSIPGGLVELGETLAEAARREVLEETGVELQELRPIETVETIERDPEGRVRHHYVLIDFWAEARGTATVASDEVLEIAWADPGALAALGLWTETVRVIAGAATARLAAAEPLQPNP